ncbi:deoxyhypusine synthase [Candidatus Micrarchaeota archaeon]|nr:deoxyhypusine synthase [Candidatus Micrarchaeota archaeon]
MKIKDLSIDDREVRRTSRDVTTGYTDNDFLQTGFQATQIARAVEIIKKMKKEKAKIFLSFTSNMVASGLRGIFAELCKRKFVDVIITAGGSLDHDLIRAYKDYELGDFFMDDVQLHKKGINRLGNILVNNECYVELEKRIKPIFERLYNKNKICAPSEIASEIGRSLNNKNSFLFWCAKNNIPVFCPGITDSAIGLQVYFFKQKYKDFGIDVTKDMQKLASIVLDAEKTGGIVLGGGISKHHTIGVNILRGGLDYAVYVTTASPWDGSLSGARTQEAISWGKLKERSRYVTVDCDATIAFPVIVGKL